MYIKSSSWSGFEIKNGIEDQFQSRPKLVAIWTMLRCIIVPNLEIVTSIGGELWQGQAQNGVNLDFQVKFDLEDKGRSVHKIIGTFTNVICIFVPNLVILDWTGLELSCGQASNWHTDRKTDTHTDAGNDNTRRPKLASGKNTYFSKYVVKRENGIEEGGNVTTIGETMCSTLREYYGLTLDVQDEQSTNKSHYEITESARYQCLCLRITFSLCHNVICTSI